MEKLKRKIHETERALKTLEEILTEPFSTIVRDATIQRFEYTFEVFWKMLKEYLKTHEGVLCNSPKNVLEELSEEQTIICLSMTDDRNLISHTYLEAVAETIYSKIRTYYDIMNYALNRVKYETCI